MPCLIMYYVFAPIIIIDKGVVILPVMLSASLITVGNLLNSKKETSKSFSRYHFVVGFHVTIVLQVHLNFLGIS